MWSLIHYTFWFGKMHVIMFYINSGLVMFSVDESFLVKIFIKNFKNMKTLKISEYQFANLIVIMTVNIVDLISYYSNEFWNES